MKVGLESKMDAVKEKELKAKMKTAGFFHCYVLGIGIASGGLSSSLWQKVLGSGIYGALISTLIVMTGYYMLDMSLSELVGVVPFAGGSFGFVRCSLGPTAGFLVASAEMCVYGFYTIRTIQKISKMITFVAITNPDLEQLWALLAYLSVLVFHLRGGPWFWNTMIGCTFYTIALLAVFFIASWASTDFVKYALDHNNGSNHANNGFIGSSDTFMENLYYPAWFFIGVCALPLAGARVKDESKVIPQAIMAAMTTMSILAILAIFTVGSQSPGIGNQMLNRTTTVLQYGFMSIGVPERYVPCLLFIPTYASATGFLFVCKHQLCAMAESGMMPAIFKKKFGPNYIPIYAVCFCTAVQYGIYLIVHHYEAKTDVPMLFRLTMIAACFMYMGVMIAFIAFRMKFENMTRQFVSPVGIPGAVVGIMIFFFVLVSLLGYQHDNHAAPLAFMCFIICMMTYYFAYVQYTQFFSKEEQDKFMKAYILNANKRKKNSRWVKFMNSVLATLDWMMCGIPSKIPSKRSGGKTSKSAGKSAAATTAAESKQSKGGVSKAITATNQSTMLPVVIVSKKVAAEPTPTPSNTIAEPPMPKKSRAGSMLRNSFATGAAALAWSGKNMDDNQSRKAFAILNNMSHEDGVEEEEEPDGDTILQSDAHDSDEIAAAKIAELLVEQLPEHFLTVVTVKDDKLAAALQSVAHLNDDDIETGNGNVEMVRAAENTKVCG